MHGLTSKGTFTAKEINRLRAAYGSLNRITIEGYHSLKRTLGVLPQPALVQLADSRIPFIDTAANSVLIDKGIRPESARWDHAIDKVTDSILAEHANAATA